MNLVDVESVEESILKSMSGFPKPCSQNETRIVHNDSCFTFVMKCVGLEKLIYKYGSLSTLMVAYEARSELVSLTKDNRVNLRPGHVLVQRYRPQTGKKYADTYTPGVGVIHGGKRYFDAGHIFIVVCPEKNLVVHMSPSTSKKGLELCMDDYSVLLNGVEETVVLCCDVLGDM